MKRQDTYTWESSRELFSLGDYLADMVKRGYRIDAVVVTKSLEGPGEQKASEATIVASTEDKDNDLVYLRKLVPMAKDELMAIRAATGHIPLCLERMAEKLEEYLDERLASR